MLGSPPPTRGKGFFRVRRLQTLGITPAYAGKSDTPLCIICQSKDHPRLRGEKQLNLTDEELPIGSPPPTRGKDWNVSPISTLYRITPAYAGKSVTLVEIERYKGDHPRLRGEKLLLIEGYHTSLGSPPPTRGKVLRRLALLQSEGITPAYAGKSSPASLAGNFPWDHPRLRGEKGFCRRLGRRHLGSPPPTRGKVICYGALAAIAGITPAYAGKSFGNFC